MAKRILNRKDLRADFEAAEARRKDEEEDVEDEDAEDEDDEDEDKEEGDEAEEEEVSEDEDEEAPPKKKAKKPAKEKVVKPKRVRTPKHIRQKVVWVVFDNSSKRIAAYDYPKKQEAEDHAARLKSEKNQTYFVQPVKEPIEEEKKEK